MEEWYGTIFLIFVVIFIVAAFVLYFTSITSTTYFLILGVLFLMMLIFGVLYLTSSPHVANMMAGPQPQGVYYHHYEMPPEHTEEEHYPDPVVPEQHIHIHNELPYTPPVEELPEVYVPQRPPPPQRVSVPINRSATAIRSRIAGGQFLPPGYNPAFASRPPPPGYVPRAQPPVNSTAVVPGRAVLDPGPRIVSTQNLPPIRKQGQFYDNQHGWVNGTLTVSGSQIHHIQDPAPYQVRVVPGRRSFPLQ